MFIARSLLFYPGNQSDNSQELSDEIIVPAYYLNRLFDSIRENEPLLINIVNQDTNMKKLVAFGTSHNFDKTIIFAPQWILDSIGHNGISDSVIKLEKTNALNLPTATKIKIKPLDPLAFEIDTLECFQRAMLNLHSIQANMVIPLTVPELGDDYKILAVIEEVEPANLCRIISSEIQVEFINEFQDITTSAAMSTAMSAAMSTAMSTTTSAAISTTTSAAINATITNTMPEPTSSELPTNNAITEITPPHPVEEISAEERRRRVIESWTKRFPSTAEKQ
jgi:Ubiquitin fusion degradation protein UFD1